MSQTMADGDAMLRATLRHGVDAVFALPGVQTYPLIDALQRSGDQVRCVGARHEQGAGYMAYGYAKATGRPGVFSVVPGPGVLNAGAAMCTATAGCAPVLCLTGDIPAPIPRRRRRHSSPVYAPRTYITSGYQGNLGFGFPTALGAKVGQPDRAAVAVVGDGGFGFAMQELSTMANENIGLTVIVFNNQAFGNVKRDQQQRFNSRTILSDLPGPSYAALAEHFGVAGFQANSPASLRPVLARALDSGAPALIEVKLDLADEVSPWSHIVPPPRV